MVLFVAFGRGALTDSEIDVHEKFLDQFYYTNFCLTHFVLSSLAAVSSMKGMYNLARKLCCESRLDLFNRGLIFRRLP